MAEKVDSAHSPPQQVALGDADLDVRRLPHLISGAVASSGPDRVALAGAINKVLIAMRAPGHATEETKVIVAALDARQLDKLVDAEGRSCRKEAVETLINGGFPHALNVAPDDLAFARAYRTPDRVATGADEDLHAGKDVARARAIGAWVVGLAQFLFAMIFFSSSAPFGTGAFLSLVAAVGAVLMAVSFARTNPPHSEEAKWGTGLGVMGVIQLLTAFAVGPPALIGGLGVLFGTLVCFIGQYEERADPPKPGDWDYREPPR